MPKLRFRFIILFLIFILLIIVSRLFFLHVIDRKFLLAQGNQRAVRIIDTQAQRGVIYDTNGQPLAVSVPVVSIWIDPQYLQQNPYKWAQLLHVLNLNPAAVNSLLKAKQQARFVYLARQLPPQVGDKIKDLDLKGVYVQQEFKRYYPNGEIMAQLIGVTNADNQGQEGVELKYNKILAGKAGRKTIIRDLLGNIVEVPGNEVEPVAGQNITLSIDSRLQYITYRSLYNTVMKYHADSGSAVIINVKTGEIMAMANAPSFNPNNRSDYQPDIMRNRVVTDTFEPGSTIKPFAMTAVLESGKIPLDTVVNTDPGHYQIGKYTVQDVHEYGTLTLTGILQKSSNVGISKLVLQIDPQALSNVLQNVGCGQVTNLKFPGERTGFVPHPLVWRPFALATLSFGYGMNATALQLAQAYMAFANHGVIVPLTLLKQTAPVQGRQAIPKSVADNVLTMLESVIEPGGTATKAKVSGFLVSGKTGTSRKSVNGVYTHQYIGVFAGIIPADNPKFVMVVEINNPKGAVYYGGDIAAPVFAEVMQQAAYIYNLPFDPSKMTKKRTVHA
jgi:cell division protein FtsI (penicillin-binding protein 3)